MSSARFASSLLLLFSLCCSTSPVSAAPPEPIALLTLPNLAHLNEADAFPGLSIYEGEQLKTDVRGRIALRSGRMALGLAESSDVTLVRISNGVHADLAAGTPSFSSEDRQVIEVHAEEALIRTLHGKPADAAITILSPKILRIDARRGDLQFSYRQAFRVLPEGQLYRIDLDAPDSSAWWSRETSHVLHLGCGSRRRDRLANLSGGAFGKLADQSSEAIASLTAGRC